jgi:hypothetical protein
MRSAQVVEGKQLMKKPKQFRAVTWVLLLNIAPLFFLIGCYTITSESDVIGEYRLDGNGKIELKVLPDKTFSETIFWPSGKIEKISGKWEWHQSGISFDQLWIPAEFAPNYIRQTDAHSENQPKYTEPGSWSMTPESHWGTATLPIFPDDELNFKMIRRFRR